MGDELVNIKFVDEFVGKKVGVLDARGRNVNIPVKTVNMRILYWLVGYM